MAALQTNDRQRYVALVYGIHRAGRTGVLELKQGRQWRKVWFLRGQPVLSDSSIESEGLEKTLVKAGLVGRRPMERVVKKLLPDERLDEELVSLGLIEEEQLVQHAVQQLERSAAAGVAWKTGAWEFQDFSDVSGSVDPGLVSEANPLRALWHEVKQQVHMDEAVEVVNAPASGKVLASDELREVLEQLLVEEPLNGLAEHIDGSGVEVEELFRRVQDRSGHLVQLLWLLESLSLVGRSKRAPDPELVRLSLGRQLQKPSSAGGSEAPEAQAAAASEKKAESPKAAKQRSPQLSDHALANLPELLATARRHRMGKNFYAFLDLNQTARVEQIEAAYNRLVKLWQAAADAASLPDSARGDARALMHAALTVWQTLSNPGRRTDYDRRLSEGRAPTLSAMVSSGSHEMPALSVPGAPQPDMPVEGAAAGRIRAARRLVDSADFGRAIPLLHKLRLENPSESAVLADLGWACWNHKAAGGDKDSAEEYLHLALTFEPRNTRALEFLARISKEKGDEDQARRLVERLLDVDPNSAWGKAAIKTFPPRDEPPKSSGRRFWKRGG